MPFEEHPIFEPPDDATVRVWRYMSLAKLLSLVSTRTVYFVRADRLEDRFEGAVSEATQVAETAWLSDVFATGHADPSTMAARLSAARRAWRRNVAISSWHLSEHESAAMWRLYLSGSEGVAVQSTFERLRDCFHPAAEAVYIGKVQYLDYTRDPVPAVNVMWPFLCKRMSFEHERELRAIVNRFPGDTPAGTLDMNAESFTDGINVDVDVEALIEQVHVPPDSDDWFLEVVKSALRVFSLDKPVVRSSLEGDPLY